MHDLENIKVPPGLLPDDVWAALVASGGPYEHWNGSKWCLNIYELDNIDRMSIRVIRLAPKPKTKPFIDWSHVVEEFKYLARDADGKSCLYTEMPDRDEDRGTWDVYGGDISHATDLTSYTPGTCDWRDSLVIRPGCEE